MAANGNGDSMSVGRKMTEKLLAAVDAKEVGDSANGRGADDPAQEGGQNEVIREKSIFQTFPMIIVGRFWPNLCVFYLYTN